MHFFTIFEINDEFYFYDRWYGGLIGKFDKDFYRNCHICGIDDFTIAFKNAEKTEDGRDIIQQMTIELLNTMPEETPEEVIAMFKKLSTVLKEHQDYQKTNEYKNLLKARISDMMINNFNPLKILDEENGARDINYLFKKFGLEFGYYPCLKEFLDKDSNRLKSVAETLEIVDKTIEYCDANNKKKFNAL
jgi:hypothetical protein